VPALSGSAATFVRLTSWGDYEQKSDGGAMGCSPHIIAVSIFEVFPDIPDIPGQFAARLANQILFFFLVKHPHPLN
jgi:hypothetical protein